jgi:hypothetical protein
LLEQPLIAAGRVLKTPPADTHRQNTAEQAADKCTDGDMVTLITTDQQIMTGLQTADTEEDRSALIILHFMEWLCGNKGKKTALSDCAAHLSPLSLFDPSFLQEGSNSMTCHRLAGVS